jgi:hypothetical protein
MPPVPTSSASRVGVPLLAIDRTVFDQNGHAFEYIQAFYRPDLDEYRMTMSCKAGDDAALWEPAA